MDPPAASRVGSGGGTVRAFGWVVHLAPRVARSKGRERSAALGRPVDMMRMSAGTLEGAVAIVTGASSGIGAAVARRLAADGAAVAIDYHAHGEPAEALAEDIRAGGGRAIAIRGDVSDEGDVARLFAATAAAFGRVDILVANAGAQKDAPVAEMTLEQWRAVIDLDLTGQFLCCREAIRRFRQQGESGRPFRAAGAIVSMSSVHDTIPWAGHVNYAASKGGVGMMVRTLAQEVAPDRIRVNAVAPGAIRTPINEDVWGDEAKLRRLLELVPYGRIGEPEDVAAAVAWLASDAADYVTGTTLYVDGGMMLYPGFVGNG